ncbi:hypothetical protein [Salibacterium sp. K-3]
MTKKMYTGSGRAVPPSRCAVRMGKKVELAVEQAKRAVDSKNGQEQDEDPEDRFFADLSSSLGDFG